ncbi:hypothetical protein [Radiobacillus sp. PE A8.2]|uniref:hypothetical protein n=1 Tax=Radiobacillus sp. PE A8.2 TaxID=3380349 RepID=UPI00388EDEB2
MNFVNRKSQVITLAAEKALKLSIIKENYWFLDDIRDNFYYGMHLYAATQDDNISISSDKQDAKKLAERMLFHSIKLQEQNKQSNHVGHWPLSLHPKPELAKPNTLPIEFFSSLLLHFYEDYKDTLSPDLKNLIKASLTAIYNSELRLRKPDEFSHHETKIFVMQLMYGQYFQNQEMINKGYDHINTVLEHVREYGLREYGSLPWLWHWIQSLDFARDYMKDESIKQTLTNLLDFMWKERTTFYMKGAWVGAHSRGLEHDIPSDENTLLDYIQFGDFPTPVSITRLEGAGFLSYQAPESIINIGVNRTVPVEVKKEIKLAFDEENNHYDSLHHYVYITSAYAIGGLWERTEEYLNEQHRWDISLPVGNQDSINQLYFFHPGEGNQEGDERHQSAQCEVLYHKNVVCALYQNLQASDHPYIIGYLPKGDWIAKDRAIYGETGDTYIAIHLQQPYNITEMEDRFVVKSDGDNNSVVVEVIDKQEASRLLIYDVNEFRKQVESRKSSNDDLSLIYKTIDNEKLELASTRDAEKIYRRINDQSIDFENYML